ncbi:putative exonuclease [Hyperthermus butylicus DSM 5456]|uniref:Transcription termination factor FttA n=1 Tax=Hyperthermus butylicus (strain DSM 5456 / JCM 9403 / PLM1-5) TaxID=415426 RepID=A2BN28_HYPBU|nr:beta-CASP ribonuclease aCPSF1 [Hyperthermus butylicus]ABM81389.1 putative exonuclease [Hyperthermus butylicus DSM 5456]
MKKIALTIMEQLTPKYIQVSRIEFEGPEIAIYVRNPKALAEHPEVAKEIAKKLKKRIVIRTDPSVRRSEKETIEVIKNLVPPEAGIKEIKFDHVLGEVIIKAEKVGLVYGKGQSIYNKVLAETGWRMNVVRIPPVDPKDLSTLNKIIDYMLSQSSYRLEFLRSSGERIHRGVIFENRYVRITALGGFMEVGRSAILIETSESKILLDVGINPSGIGYNLYPRLDIDQLNLEELDAVVVTHAHLDHIGLVPYLFKYGYRGPVYATKPTRDLMVLLLLDLLDIMQRSGQKPPYTQQEVKKMILHTIPLDYGEVTDIAPDMKLTFYNAGHILGSAIAHIHIGEGLHNIVYTGDFKFGRTRLLDKAHTEFPRVETLIMESTYGDRDQPRRDEAELELISVISKTIARRGKVLIPVMAVGRAQEILLVLVDALRKKLLPPETKIYIDGSIKEVTAIHLTYPELLSAQVRARILRGENPFDHENIVRVEGRQMREDIAKSDEPGVILATAGMLTGGPSVEYLRLLAPDPRNVLVFVSYQAKGTLGRRILDGEREITMVDEEGKPQLVRIQMEVKSIDGFSGHSDRRQLLAFLANMKPKPKNIILNHGEPQSIHALAETIRRRARHLGLPEDIRVYTPTILDTLHIAGVA